MSKSVYGEIGSKVVTTYVEAREKMTNEEAMKATLKTHKLESERSLRSFLSSVAGGKVYKSDEVRKVGGASGTRKVGLVKEIAEATGIEFAELESLEKANKATLEALLAKVKAE